MTDSNQTAPVGSTTGSGAPAASDRNSLSIGPDGLILLHDVHFLEQMAHFNREKLPERQPHAKGAGTFGVLQVTGDVAQYSKDPMKFPHFIRSQKRLADSGLRDNHMQWDFWTNNPESAHQVTYLMGERGLPRT